MESLELPDEAGLVVIEFDGLDDAIVADFEEMFTADEEQVITTSSFDGTTTIAIIALLASGPLKLLCEYFKSRNVMPSKTRIRVTRTTIEIAGFDYDQAVELLHSQQLEKAASLVRK